MVLQTILKGLKSFVYNYKDRTISRLSYTKEKTKKCITHVLMFLADILP